MRIIPSAILVAASEHLPLSAHNPDLQPTYASDQGLTTEVLSG